MDKLICIAEDSRSQAKILHETLTGRGYAVVLAENGLEGLYKVNEAKPDLIISDVEMPQMDGYEFCRTVKNDRELKRIPFIMLTLLSSIKDVVKGLEAGADYFITKPYDSEVLLSTVESVLKREYSGNGTAGPVSVHVDYNGDMHRFEVDPQRIMNFFCSTYENLINQNQNLFFTKQELKRLNNNLEEKVREKTRFLEEEIAERVKAENAIKDNLVSMRKTLDGTVRALATTIEMRDPYTAGHQRRVAQLSRAIGRKMGFSQEFVDGLEVMGFLHDIGKIIVPAEILSKPGVLNEFEFNIIKAHAQAGYNILRGIEFPWPVGAATIQHHERLDGSGYPHGISGDTIIMEARILAVADVVEAMATHRPYRPSLGIEIALKEVIENSGTRYDPNVVEVCKTLFETKEFTFE
ncbi:MAG TPA: response regulator [Syntrophorhabdaceae bacterium]|nr:response regulator [Syntrophorhabdaceae bacterium]